MHGILGLTVQIKVLHLAWRAAGKRCAHTAQLSVQLVQGTWGEGASRSMHHACIRIAVLVRRPTWRHSDTWESASEPVGHPAA